MRLANANLKNYILRIKFISKELFEQMSDSEFALGEMESKYGGVVT